MTADQEVLTQTEPGNSEPTRGSIIDVDVHESLRSLHELIPYLVEPYRSRVAVPDGFTPPSFPYAYPMINGVAMADAVQEDGDPAGSSYEQMREQLLDKYDIAHAILAGGFYPGDMRVQPGMASALASAYNDWLIENWLARDGRFLGSVCIAPQDPVAAAREIDRVGAHPQMVQVMIPVLPYDAVGREPYHPIFEAAVRNDLVIGFHQSNTTATSIGYPELYIEWHTAIVQNWQSQLIGLVAHGVFDKFPDLRVVLVEAGWSWIPALLWRFDYNFRSLRRDTPWVKRLPSEHIRDNVRATTQPMEYPENPHHVYQMFEMLGSDEFLLFSTDYPHWDFDSPHQAIPRTFPKELRQKILFENARKFYRL